MTNKEIISKMCTEIGLSEESLITNEVECQGESFSVTFIGNDDCWDKDEFYQYGITEDGKILKFYFKVPEICNDMSDVDYSTAYNYVDDTNNWID